MNELHQALSELSETMLDWQWEESRRMVKTAVGTAACTTSFAVGNRSTFGRMMVCALVLGNPARSLASAEFCLN